MISVSKKKLTKKTNATGASRLDTRSMPFRVAIEEQLENGYTFKDMTKDGLTHLHRFLEETVGKKQSITDVEKRFKRKGDGETVRRGNEEYEVIHLGKNGNRFRIFGYYSGTDFILLRIDQNHSVHKV